MEKLSMRRDRAMVVFAAVVAIGCGNAALPSLPPEEDAGKPVEESVFKEDTPAAEDVGTVDDAGSEMDASVDLGTEDVGDLDTAAIDDRSTPDDATATDAGLDATPPRDASADDGPSTPDVVAVDVQVSCRRVSDCAGVPGRAACDLVSGLCVECVPTSDSCPTGSYCDATRRCAPGCRNGSDCVGVAGAPICDAPRRVCVGCLANTDCAIGNLCTGGMCVPGCTPTRGCATGATCCSGACVDTSTSVTACGSCTRVCSTIRSTPTCTAGACVASCEAGWGDCDANRDNGCETSTTNNPSNCGACGVVCSIANASATCANDRCAIVSCSAGFQDCDRSVTNGCEAALATSVANCGACGNTCATGQSCNSGVCQCPAGQTICLGACTPTQTDPLNCGACNLACPAGQRCVAGMCSAMTLYHGWTSPVPGCSTTSYNTTALTNLGGRYPFNVGDSNACRAWKLAATVCTTQPMPYSGNENFSCPQSGGFTDPTFGTYCAVASQYSCSTCPGACNAACAYSPLSLRNCAGRETAQP